MTIQNPRQLAQQSLQKIIQHHQSLTPALFTQHSPAAQQMVYGVMRYWHRLDGLVKLLLDKPLKTKDQDIHMILLIGCYELLYSHTVDYAVISESVNLVTKLGKSWAKGLVNALLRRVQRQQQQLIAQLDTNDVTHYSHPQWLIDALQQAYPDPSSWQTILTTNNTQAPMTLRINPTHGTREQYLQTLAAQNIQAIATALSPDGVTLAQPQSAISLPGFDQGWVTIQDEAAQYAAHMLDCQPRMQVLDACAAPGNKTAHIAALQPTCHVLALDKDPGRVQSIQTLQQRLKFSAKIVCADATQVATWWDGKPFDRILLDAPCSATGVIRRHPDIKYHRRFTDIAALVKQQQQLLMALWSLLSEHGHMLYVTCSLLPQENQQQMAWFLQQQQDAVVIETQQLFPTQNGHDGLFFTKIGKVA